MNPRPISNRKKVQLFVALTILAWATQTLMHQWARGEDAPQPGEQFVPNVNGVDVGATLELKSEATVYNGEVQLRQICRWADADAKFFRPLSDLVVARFQGKSPFQSISMADLRQTLHDSGANLGLIRFAGATSCTVTRSDKAPTDDPAALEEWSKAREGKLPAASPLQGVNKPPATIPLSIAPADMMPPETKPQARATAHAAAATPVAPGQTLRDRIIADASVRLKVPADQLQMNFNPADDAALNLAEPQFKFNLDAVRVFGLGEVSWDVLVVSEGGNKHIPITATARAWEMQVVLVRPVAYKQVIQKDDVVTKRVLVDRLSDETLLAFDQCVNQESSQELKPGMVMTARMVNPVDLAKAGQFITVTMASGNVHIKTVGRAMENGTYGQTIKVKNEATDATYEVVLTGPQEGTISPPRAGTASLDRN